MSFQDTPFFVQNMLRVGEEVRLIIRGSVPEPDPLQSGQTVYLTTEPPKATPRTSDMQDLVDRCEAKAASVQGWRTVAEPDGSCTRIKDGDRLVCMIPTKWWLLGKTPDDLKAELGQRREDYFRNVPLLVNAQCMFDLLKRLRDDKCVFNNDLEEELDQLINQIKTQQWEPETPKG